MQPLILFTRVRLILFQRRSTLCVLLHPFTQLIACQSSKACRRFALSSPERALQVHHHHRHSASRERNEKLLRNSNPSFLMFPSCWCSSSSLFITTSSKTFPTTRREAPHLRLSVCADIYGAVWCYMSAEKKVTYVHTLRMEWLYHHLVSAWENVIYSWPLWLGVLHTWRLHTFRYTPFTNCPLTKSFAEKLETRGSRRRSNKAVNPTESQVNFLWQGTQQKMPLALYTKRKEIVHTHHHHHHCRRYHLLDNSVLWSTTNFGKLCKSALVLLGCWWVGWCNVACQLSYSAVWFFVLLVVAWILHLPFPSWNFLLLSSPPLARKGGEDWEEDVHPSVSHFFSAGFPFPEWREEANYRDAEARACRCYIKRTIFVLLL